MIFQAKNRPAGYKKSKTFKKCKNLIYLFFNRHTIPDTHHRFACKKMRHLMKLFFCILTAGPLYGQDSGLGRASVSADMTSLLKYGMAEISFSHLFIGNWSAEGGVSLKPPSSVSGPDTEKETHESDLAAGDEAPVADESMKQTMRMGFRFWTDTYMKGASFGIGCVLHSREKPCLSIDAGYTIRIFSHAAASITYGIGIPAGSGNGITSQYGLKLKLSYIF